MVKKGVGAYQVDRALTAFQTIMKTLMDGQWHRYQELQAKTGLSSATLSKHLKELEKGVAEKKILLESGKYPYPVVYRIKEQYQHLLKGNNLPDVPTLNRKTKTDTIMFGEEVREYLRSAAQALNKTVNEALSIYEVDKNPEAFQQSAGTAIALYNEALQAVKNRVYASTQIRKRS
jgi:DNA-binding transcriptional ArsR family regulator